MAPPIDLDTRHIIEALQDRVRTAQRKGQALARGRMDSAALAALDDLENETASIEAGIAALRKSGARVDLI